MMNVVVFENVQELSILTGLDGRDELEMAGFDLDDWDFGIQIDHVIHDVEFDFYEHYGSSDREYVYGVKERAVQHDQNTYYENEIFDSWQSYFCGGSYTEYGGKHYYLWHHT